MRRPKVLFFKPIFRELNKKKLEKGKTLFGNSKRFQSFKRRNKILYKNLKKNNKKDYQKDYESHSRFKKKKSKLLLFRDRLIDLLFRDKLIERYKSSETKKENDSINLHEIIIESPIEKNMNDRTSPIRNHIEIITKSETINRLKP